MNTQGIFHKTLKRDLRKIITDKDVMMQGTRVREIFGMSNMTDAYDDDQVYGGIGRADEQTEGANITIGSVTQGPSFRWKARKYGKRMIVTDEALEDCKYKEAIKGAKRCVRAVVKGAEYEGALFFDRSFDTNYLFGDGVPLCSASHPLAVGGTFSNIFATPMAPSVAAYAQARTQALGFPSHDGLIDSVDVKGVIFPKEQLTEWQVITGSKLETSENNFSRLNVAERANLKLMMNQYITASVTNYWFKTDSMDGIDFRVRRKMRSRTWSENANETVHYSCTMRWAFGHNEPRNIIGVGS